MNPINPVSQSDGSSPYTIKEKEDIQKPRIEINTPTNAAKISYIRQGSKPQSDNKPLIILRNNSPKNLGRDETLKSGGAQSQEQL